MRFLILVFLVFSSSSWLYSQSVMVWQGFEQNWGYNHRVNRIGDYIQPLDSHLDSISPKWEWVHTAASGSGADLATFDLHAGMLRLEDSFIHESSVEFSLCGNEGEWLEGDTTILLPHQAPHFIATLQGFDLCTQEGFSADKLMDFSIQIEDGLPAPEGFQAIHIKYKAKFDCTTAECPKFDQKTGYTLKIFWLAIQSQKKWNYSQNSVNSNWEWDKKGISALSEGFAFPERKTLPEIRLIRGFSISLDKDHHYQSLKVALPAPNGSSTIGSELLFLPWTKSMRDAYKTYYSGRVKPPASWVVKRSKGTAFLQLDYYSLASLPTDRFTSINGSGTIHWKTTHGHQIPANSEAATFRRTYP